MGNNPVGTTNLISDEPTAYRPHAALLMATETPFNSIGSAGARFDSDALLLLTVTLDGARLALDWKTAISPAARPRGTNGVGLAAGVGDGLGVGLAVGLGVAVGLATGTPIRLAPVNAVSVAADYVEGDERFVQIDTAYKDGQCLISTRQSEKNYGEDELIVTEPSMTAYRVDFVHEHN